MGPPWPSNIMQCFVCYCFTRAIPMLKLVHGLTTIKTYFPSHEKLHRQYKGSKGLNKRVEGVDIDGCL